MSSEGSGALSIGGPEGFRPLKATEMVTARQLVFGYKTT